MTKLALCATIATMGLFISSVGCGKKNDAQNDDAGRGAAPLASSAEGMTLTGAGATFPYPIYSKWSNSYAEAKKVQINYQSIGSGGGIQQIKAKTVEFGASDAPLKIEELDAAGLVQFPMVIGGVVPVVHLQELASGSLALDGETLAGLFLGDIKKWNDPKIRAINPGVNLPAKDVTIVRRADGSGTTWIFTHYLSKVSKAWAEKVGNDKSVSWPTGMGGKGNEGVASYVDRIDGSLGYVEFAYASQNKLHAVKLKNAAGAVVEPTMDAFQAAAANADWKGSPGFYVVLTDQPGEKSWPITGASFILMHREQKDALKAAQVLGFFDYAYRSGSAMAKALDYVPMPMEVVSLVQEMWATKIHAGSKAVWSSNMAQK